MSKQALALLVIGITIGLNCLLSNYCIAYQVGTNPSHRKETLEPSGTYILDWEVLWSTNEIRFIVAVETDSWIGFGFANDKKDETLLDLIIGSVSIDGTADFKDYHMLIGDKQPSLDNDTSKDWATIDSTEEEGPFTILTFHRSFDTCDPEDVAITMSKICVFWAYGLDDNWEETELKFKMQGFYCLYLLDPDFAPKIERDRFNNPLLRSSESNTNIPPPPETQVWSVKINRQLPESNTAYLCTMYEAPPLDTKHTFIGYDVTYLNEESKKHIHHMIMLRCHAPSVSGPFGESLSNNMFEAFVGSDNWEQTCYIFDARHAFPMAFCNELYIGWGIGGRTFFLPDDVGFPFGGNSEPEYFVFQIHYDNPDELKNVDVGIRFDFFYTNKSREHWGGLMGVLGDVPGFPEYILLEPDTEDHEIYSHCSPECTKRIFPAPINIVAVGLHSHNSGRTIIFHHFRKGEKMELPWFSYDFLYDNTLQTIRHLRKWVEMKPGDQLTVDCTYSTEGETVVGGFSTRQEMCMTFIVYISRGPQYSFCTSGLKSEENRREFLGVEECTWVEEKDGKEVLEWIADSPENVKGKKITKISHAINWTPELRAALKTYQTTHSQVAECHKDIYARFENLTIWDILFLLTSSLFNFPPFGKPTLNPQFPTNSEDDFTGVVGYPFDVTPYVPPGRGCPKVV